MKVTVNCPAKINLSLDVVGKREDGYHDVEMVMQTVFLFDVVTVEKKGAGITLSCNFPYVPTDEKNVAFRAALEFFSYTKTENPGIHINIKKKIPVAAGLAGGSTDAAGVLLALNRLFDTELKQEELKFIGTKIGADVPFCIQGGTALCRGLGELITPLPSLSPCYFVLVKPPESVSTPRIYNLIDQKPITAHPFTNELIKSIESRDIRLMSRYLFNVMEAVTEKICRHVPTIRTMLSNFSPLGIVMSGSGPTVYAVFESEEQANKCLKEMTKTYSQSFLCSPCGPPSVQSTSN